MIAHSGRARIERKVTGLTVAECRDRIVEHLRELDRWVPIAELAAWMKAEFGSSHKAGDAYLRTLVGEGRLGRRATAPEALLYKHYEYRARP